MKAPFSLFVLLVLALKLPAQQTIVVTSASLADWTVTGADSKSLAKLPELALPAGAQLARSLSSNDVMLKIVTNPVVSATAADWPMVEIGDCALVFARSETGGKLTLILGANQPIDLPFSYALDETGRSAEPLTVYFRRQGPAVGIILAGQALQFPAGPTTDTVLEVVVSPGATNPWLISELTLSVGGPFAEETAPDISTGGLLHESDLLTLNTNRSRSVKTGGSVIMLATSVERANGKAVAGSRAGSGSALEIYTPPSNRRGRADAIRAAIAPDKAK